MKSKTWWLCAGAVFAASVAWPLVLLAEDAGEIHLQGDNTGFLWTVADGAQKSWDINSNGQVNSGTNAAYSNGGMILTMNGAGFASNGTARLSKNKREIEIGPWQWGNISVSRRIYVDQAQGYCRWIDIFETNCGQDQQVNLRYQTNHASPLKEMVTSSGGKQFTPKKDYAWAAVLNDAARPVVVHVFCSRGAKEAPTPQCNVGAGDTYYNYPITVTNGKPVALCFFESQQPDADKARQFMKDFDPQAELGKVPPAPQDRAQHRRPEVHDRGHRDAPQREIRHGHPGRRHRVAGHDRQRQVCAGFDPGQGRAARDEGHRPERSGGG